MMIAIRPLVELGLKARGKWTQTNFSRERKPVFHWFLLALLVFTIIDYLFVPRSGCRRRNDGETLMDHQG
jgi:hypothetical protein